MRTKPIFIYAFIALVSILLSSCWMMGPSVKGNGKVREEVRQVKKFDRIESSLGINVYITQGSPASVVVRADENLHKLIETEVHGGVLEISCRGSIRRAEELKVLVTAENLLSISSSTGSNVYTQNQIKAEELEVSAKTGSNVTMDLNVQSLEVKCSTGSNIFLSGQAKEAKLEGSIGSNLKAKELKTADCRIKASSGANIFVSVNGELEADASSGGNIFYYGEPTSTDIDSSSGGNVQAR